MRLVLTLCLSATILIGAVRAEDKPAAEAPKIVLSSPDGKQTVDLSKLVKEGPVLVRLTCACTGCDKELPQFQKLQAAYNAKGLRTVAVFREKPEALESYVVKKDVKFLWLSDPKGELWKTFDAKAMPTNILIDKGGKIVKIVPGCTPDGKNAQLISAEVAKLLKTDEAQVVEKKEEKKEKK
jgi:peroxiredoxin